MLVDYGGDMSFAVLFVIELATRRGRIVAIASEQYRGRIGARAQDSCGNGAEISQRARDSHIPTAASRVSIRKTLIKTRTRSAAQYHFASRC
jgi:hypothetical protein